jgi:adenylosuccinate synthase
VYEYHDGWKESLAGIRSYQDLPEAAKQYIIAIEKIAGAKVSIISLSPDRADTIIR